MRCTSILLLSAIVALSACDRDDGPAESSILAPVLSHSTGTWGHAVPVVGVNLNTAALEGCPSESPDGRSLFFASNRSGNLDIYVSHRQNSGEWGAPESLDDVNSSAGDYCPSALPDGGLLFVSERDDGHNCAPGKADMYQTRLHPTRGWLPPEHLGCDINSAGNEFSPSFVPAGGGMLFFSSDRTGVPGIYVSYRDAGSWQAPQPIPQLNAGGPALRPNVSADGRTIVFDSNRGDSNMSDIWYSHRSTVIADWAEPVRLQDASINSAANETRPWMSHDGRLLYFGSNRAGSFDLYVAHRR